MNLPLTYHRQVSIENTLIQKAKVHYQKYENQPNRKKDLWASHQTYLLASHYVEKVKNEYRNKTDKEALNKNYFPAFEGGILTSFELQQFETECLENGSIRGYTTRKKSLFLSRVYSYW